MEETGKVYQAGGRGKISDRLVWAFIMADADADI